MDLRTCVDPSGQFVYGIHKPRFKVKNLRENDYISFLGSLPNGQHLENRENFPPGAVEEAAADWIFEIPNAFPFRGATFIVKSRADIVAADPAAIILPQRPSVSFSDVIKQWYSQQLISTKEFNQILTTLPEPLLLALAANSTDGTDLSCLADLSAEFVYDPNGRPMGLVYEKDNRSKPRARIKHQTLFHILANNKFLPDDYKDVMVLRPGAQGKSEIVGEWLNQGAGSHVFEYLRRNSYIPWGHYAANMANDAVRYEISELTMSDMTAMRHLYYQRSYIRLADDLGFSQTSERRTLTVRELEDLRNRINDARCSEKKRRPLQFNCTLWGWNFGFDFAPSHYRLHASHQQIHQQYALVPATVSSVSSKSHGKKIPAELTAFSCGDQISAFIADYRRQTGKNFFETYIRAIQSNSRLDSKKRGEARLVVYADEHVMVFIPKAQTSQWEIQLMTLKPVGNILETDTATRRALDRAMLITIKMLAAMGVELVATIEYSKRFDSLETDQRLLYAFFPRLPQSPGAFTEAQLRFINNHYPEDFASACRSKVSEALKASEI